MYENFRYACLLSQSINIYIYIYIYIYIFRVYTLLFKSVNNPNKVLNAWLINTKHTCRAKYIIRNKKID